MQLSGQIRYGFRGRFLEVLSRSCGNKLPYLRLCKRVWKVRGSAVNIGALRVLPLGLAGAINTKPFPGFHPQ